MHGAWGLELYMLDNGTLFSLIQEIFKNIS